VGNGGELIDVDEYVMVNLTAYYQEILRSIIDLDV